jgi:orotate phosphoribosyltransferase
MATSGESSGGFGTRILRPQLGETLPAREERIAELGRDLVNAAYLRGDFVLSSGMRSSYYFDKYLFETKPSILRRVATFLAELIPHQTDRIAGPELGAVALATAVSLETGLPFVIVKKRSKDYATKRVVEGELYAGERVVVVEDILTTGAAAIRAADQVKLGGGEVLKVLAVIDREQGATQNIASAGYQSEALFRRHQLGV